MKIKRVGFTMEFLTTLLTTGNHITSARVVDGLPEDAVICGVQLHGGVIWFDIRSDSFPEVKEGEEIPPFAVLLERVTTA